MALNEAEADLWGRLDYRRRTLGPGARCSLCGIGIVLVLFRMRSVVVCYQCFALRRGRSGYELHHLGGEGGVPILVWANLHRLLSAWQDITWRGEVEPGSADAIRCDVAGLLVIGSAYLRAVPG